LNLILKCFQNDFFVTGSEDGAVCKYSLDTNSMERILTRCTLPIRDLAISPDGSWVAIASESVAILDVLPAQSTDRLQ
jgi:chromosome transmission fidelity protein 4